MKEYKEINRYIKARFVLMGLIDSPYINFYKIYVEENSETQEMIGGIGGPFNLTQTTYTYKLAIDYELDGIEKTIYGEEDKGIVITSTNQRDLFKEIIEQLNKEIYEIKESKEKYFIRMLNYFNDQYPWDTTRQEIDTIKEVLIYLLNKE